MSRESRDTAEVVRSITEQIRWVKVTVDHALLGDKITVKVHGSDEDRAVVQSELLAKLINVVGQEYRHANALVQRLNWQTK